jgi:hypothetical protein
VGVLIKIHAREPKTHGTPPTFKHASTSTQTQAINSDIIMCAAKVITASKSTPVLDLNKLNLPESIQLLTLALQKYPKFANDVSKVLDATSSRIRRENAKQKYQILTDKMYEEIHARDDWDEMEKYRYVDGGDPNGNVFTEVMDKIGKSITNETSNEVFEVAFKAAMDCWGMLGAADESKDENDLFDWEEFIDDARGTVREMALLWVQKDGECDKDRYKLVLKLLEDMEWDDEGLAEVRDALAYECGDSDEEDEEDAEGPELKRIRIE